MWMFAEGWSQQSGQPGQRTQSRGIPGRSGELQRDQRLEMRELEKVVDEGKEVA